MRTPLRAAQLEKLHKLLDEAFMTIEGNFDDERFDRLAKREVVAKITFEPDKRDPEQIQVISAVNVKLPPRMGKIDFGVLREGVLLLERYAEDFPLFPRKVDSATTADQEDEERDYAERAI